MVTSLCTEREGDALLIILESVGSKKRTMVEAVVDRGEVRTPTSCGGRGYVGVPLSPQPTIGDGMNAVSPGGCGGRHIFLHSQSGGTETYFADRTAVGVQIWPFGL
jgi:hypothetical protein